MSVKRPDDQYLKVGDINTRFWETGKGAPTLILLHGIGCFVEMWEKNIEALSRDHRVYAVDIMGFGRSDKPSVSYTFQLLSDFVLDFMETLGIKKATFIGNSMGGGISLFIAIQSPEKVDRLVLVDTYGLGKKVSPILSVMSLPVIGELLTRPSRGGTVRMMKLCLHDLSAVSDDFIDRGFQMASLPGAQKAFLSMLRSGGSIFGLNEELLRYYSGNFNKIGVPVLVIWGKQDRIFPVLQAQTAVKRIPNAKLHVMNQAGHFPQLDRPMEFNDVVLGFLHTS